MAKYNDEDILDFYENSYYRITNINPYDLLNYDVYNTVIKKADNIDDFTYLFYNSPHEYIEETLDYYVDIGFPIAEISVDFKLTKKQCLNYLYYDKNPFKYIPNEYFYDEEFVLSACEQNEYSLKYLPKNFLFDKEVCFTAVNHFPHSIKYVPYEMRDSVISLSSLVAYSEFKEETSPWEHIPEELQNDMYFLYDVAIYSPYVFLDFTDEFKNNRDIVKLFLEREGDLLSKVPLKFREEKELVLLAAKSMSKHSNITYMDSPFGKDVDFIKDLIHINLNYLHYAHYSLRDSADLAHKVLKHNNFRFHYANFFHEEIFLNEPDLLISYIDKDVSCIKMIPSKLRKNPEFLHKVFNVIEETDLVKFELSFNDEPILIEYLKFKGDFTHTEECYDNNSFRISSLMKYIDNKDFRSFLNENNTYEYLKSYELKYKLEHTIDKVELKPKKVKI